MAFLGKGSIVYLQVLVTEIGVEDVLGLKVFELREAILNNKYFDEELSREFLTTIIEERKRKEEIKLDEIKNSIICEVQTFEEVFMSRHRRVDRRRQY
ncbi:hypothetical protein TNCV_3522611 [Trichonephila clavipes]|uniref:Uncharacterized protein n=1 Tax=Trichonephila clavipes TaxID=2585209 RepID=A0A8X7BGP3_TRICX|nr:hypothetical protein TNCV_3522611 [Trichonephila clavipes]